MPLRSITHHPKGLMRSKPSSPWMWHFQKLKGSDSRRLPAIVSSSGWRRISLTLSLLKHGYRRGGTEPSASRFTGARRINGAISGAHQRALVGPARPDFINVGTLLIKGKCGFCFGDDSNRLHVLLHWNGNTTAGVIHIHAHLLLKSLITDR